jgi:trigger factor
VAKIPEQLNTAVAGKDAVYEVTLRAVKEPVLPEVDDALADRISPGKNLEQLRADLRTRLEDMALEREKEARVEAAKQALLSLVEFDLPETIVNQTAQRRVNQLVNANLERGVDQQTLMANEQAILQTATERAKLDVKEEFLLAEISKREGFKVSDQELSLRVSQIAATARTSPKNVMKVMQKEDPDAMDNLRYSMRLDKARQFLADNAQVTEKAVNMGDEPGAEQE